MATQAIDTTTHRHLAATCFCSCWELMEKTERTPEEDRTMVSLAYASRWHWTQVEDREAVTFSRSEWQVSRALVLAGWPEAGLDHARSGLEWIEQHPEIGAFDRAFAHESIARAQVALGRHEEAEQHLQQARELAAKVTEKEDRIWLISQLEAIVPQVEKT
jgi:hypothetical protein